MGLPAISPTTNLLSRSIDMQVVPKFLILSLEIVADRAVKMVRPCPFRAGPNGLRAGPKRPVEKWARNILPGPSLTWAAG